MAKKGIQKFNNIALLAKLGGVNNMKKLLKKSDFRIEGLFDRFITNWVVNEKKVMAIMLIMAVVFPLFFNQRYILSILINFCIYAILALSLNLLTGFMGITSLGHAAFYGLGAYTAAILGTRYGLNMAITFPAGMIVAAVLAFLLGLPAIKSPVRHLAIITLGFCEIIRITEFNWFSLTGGPNGIHSIPTLSILGIEFSSMTQRYYIALILLIVTYYIMFSITNSRVGRAISAVRDNEIAAESMGVNVYMSKLIVFTISAAFAGLAGAFYAHHVQFISPVSFAFEQSVLILGMVILGGMGNLRGSLIGAMVLSLIPELLRGMLYYRQVLYGLIIVALMVIRPSGLLGKYNFRYIRQKKYFEDSINQ